LLLAGCLTAPKVEGSPDQWPSGALTDATIMPTPQELEPERLNRRTRVVVLPAQDAPNLRGAGLPDTAVAALEQVLNTAAEVVDRRMASRLGDEVKLAEVRGTGNYGGPDVADFAVSLSMGNATWGSSYVQQVVRDGKVVVPASHVHTGKSSMTVRVYQVPSLRMVASFQADGSASVGGVTQAATASDAPRLMRAATEDAIKSRRADILNELSPRGYISDKRVKDKRTIFRALISRQSGAKPGDDVEVFTLKSNTDPLTKRTLVEEEKVADGTVSNIVGQESSWIIVDKEREAAAVRRGDIVRVKHKRPWWEALPIKLP